MITSLFISHGSPMLIFDRGQWAQTLRSTGERIKSLNPELILIVSAHWLTEGTEIECSESLKTIHDFYGFSEELYRLEYPAKGNPELCKDIAKEIDAKCVSGRGLDHGAWAILWHLLPEANIPISQLSIDVSKDLDEHLELGRRLRSFRDRVVIIASGGVVHNLRDAVFNPEKPPQWAIDFNEFIKEKVLKRDVEALLRYKEHKYGNLAHPTEEHFIPLIYFMGTLNSEEKVKILYDGFEFGSVSLLSFTNS